MRHSIFTVIFLSIFTVIGCNKSEAQPSSTAPKTTAQVTTGGGGGEISKDPAVIANGEKLFASKTCSACHQMDARVVGPPLKGVTQRRSVAWLTQMIKDPTKFTKTDPEAKKLYEEYKTPMPAMPMTDAEISAIIAYLDTKK
jgi:mono/diheme cytochrome c family protein